MRLLFMVTFFAFSASAKTIYVKAKGGNGSGISDETAWNFATLANSTLSFGDKVLFKRGDVFFGAIQAVSGVIYGAYGKGANPVITGLQQLSGWARFSDRIYVVPLSVSKPVNLVVLAGNIVSMGRFPNAGYLQFTSHRENAGIQGQYVGSLPFAAAGAEAVIRKSRRVLDRQPVVTHRKDLLTLSTSTDYPGPISRDVTDNNGFFIQNHLATLDREGEWWYDRLAKKLYMVLSKPTDNVFVSVVDKLVTISGQRNVTLMDIDFKGSNTAAIAISNSSAVSIVRCRFNQHGQEAVYGSNTSGLTIKNSSVSNCLNNGIWVEQNGRYTTINNVSITDCGTIAGAGSNGRDAYQGISVSGDNTTIDGCTVSKTGYHAIRFNGSFVRVENNTVSRFCLVKDDGAGIYTSAQNRIIPKKRVIRDNTIFHAVGAFGGAEGEAMEKAGKAAGIYLDSNSCNTELAGNRIAYGPWAGIVVNNSAKNTITGNHVYGYPVAILLEETKRGTIKDLLVKDNHLMCRQSLYIKLLADDEPVRFGSFSGNCYQRGKPIIVDRRYTGGSSRLLSLKEWKALGIDLDSVD